MAMSLRYGSVELAFATLNREDGCEGDRVPMADLPTVKKKAQEYQFQSEASGLIRMTQVTLALLAAIGAVVRAFGGLHEADRVFSTVVVITILWEVIGYGFHQWHGIHAAARDYKRLAADITVGARDLAAAQAELSRLVFPAR